MNRPPIDDDPAPVGPSKSQVKRGHLALQTWAERLAHLPHSEWDALDLNAATREALTETARIRDPRALRRHYKRIAQCLAREHVALEEWLATREHHARAAHARLHGAERWRARLLAEGDAALSEFLADHPGADRQRLRALIRAARRDTEQGKTDAPRRLFRFVRDVLEHGEIPG